MHISPGLLEGKKMLSKLRILALAVATLGMVTVIASPAAAVTTLSTRGDREQHGHNCPGDAAGGAYTASSGWQETTAYDWCSDGHSAVLSVITGQGVSAHVWNTGGLGSPTVRKENFFRSGTHLTLKACVGEWSTRAIFGCGEPKTVIVP